MTHYHSKYWAHALTCKGIPGSIDSISRSIANSKVDLNPHQIDAALFVLNSPLSKGAVLADEVGLGKTIEAGIIIAQRWAERRRHILLIVPASLRKQWERELIEKFLLPVCVLDRKIWNEQTKSGLDNPFNQREKVLIASYQFIVAHHEEVSRVPWDLVIIDEAHRLRNVFKNSNKQARSIQNALQSSSKLLLTATPLQNSLMELYGLVSIIDPHVFGDAESFKNQFLKDFDIDQRNFKLKERLSSYIKRTLRKQVTEFISFTKRIPITQDFSPTNEEHALYEVVSNYLQRESLIALPASQRTLITLVLRKLLASSTFAISQTLKKLVERLEKKQNELVSIDEFDSLEEIEEEWEIIPQQEVKNITDNKKIELEIQELKNFANLADSILINAKGESLIIALKVAFEQTSKLNALRKAVIFTESRHTQTYLFNLLTLNGFDGQVIMINASNSDPISEKIYQEWLLKHKDTDLVTGSRAIDVKAALVENFKEKATILIATEAASEGVNLQFCSLVVNYDLPWNPQRIEQRIGRCHRYGQKHDVVVVNFINTRNKADQRVYELLGEKFKLFEGVFGASDEVLGILESGIDFERRISQVYQTCRSESEILAAFDLIQKELDEYIQEKLKATKQELLENFDQDVSERLKISRNETEESLSKRERWLFNLAKNELRDASFDHTFPRFSYRGHDGHNYYNLNWKEAEKNNDVFFRLDHPLAVRLIENAINRTLKPSLVKFNYSNQNIIISALKPFLGIQGSLELYRLKVSSLDEEESLLFCAETDEGVELEPELCEKLFLLPAEVFEDSHLEIKQLLHLFNKYSTTHLCKVEERNHSFFDKEVQKLDLWAEDLKDNLEKELKEIDRKIKEAKKEAGQAKTLAEKLESQKQIKSLENTRSLKRRELFHAHDQIDENRNKLILDIEKQLKQSHSYECLFRFKWQII